MAENLEQLLARIRAEGLEKAKAEADEVLASARGQAQTLLAEAQAQADRLRQEAQADAERQRQSGQAALELAARDLLLTVRGRLARLLGELLRQATGQALTPQTLATLLAALFARLDGSAGAMAVSLAPADLEALRSGLLASFRERLAQGLTLGPDDELRGGFTVRLADQGVVLDASDRALAEALMRLVRPELARILDAASRPAGS